MGRRQNHIECDVFEPAPSLLAYIVIYIDPTTGILRHDRKLGYDVFNSQDEALNYITDDSRTICKSTTYAKAILGYAVLGGIGLLLVATKLTASILYLPGGRCIYIISKSKWIKITLLNPQPPGKGEVKNVQELTEFEIDGKHYWNRVRTTCMGSKKIVVSSQQRGREIAKATSQEKKRWDVSSYLYWTGNEIECEQLVWVPKRFGQNVHFNTYVLYTDLGDAYRLFEEIPERNSVSWSVMVGEFDKTGDYMKCFEIFREKKNGCGDGEEMIKGDVE
ncbi:hypothetical protein Tco_1440567 [Tanacetum coccineum]